MNVKAQALLNAVKWIEEEYGASTVAEIIRQCSPAVRERYVSAIAIEWHPVEELVQFLEVCERVLGSSDGKIAERIGAAGARANMRGAFVQIAFYVARPEFLFKRVAGLWRQFNDDGEMRVVALDAGGHMRVEVVGTPTPHALFCATLTGWCREFATITGVANVSAKHIECRARGQQRCIWEVRGMKIEIEPPP